MDAVPDWIEELRVQALERQDPWVVLEGRQSVEAAVVGWWDLSGILASEDCTWEPPDWSGLELLRRPSEMLAEIGGHAAPGDVIGLARQPDETRDVAGLMAEIDEDALVIVCPSVLRGEQAGMIMRSAAALGAKAVIFGREGVSPFERISVAASEGAIFQLPVRVADGGQILRCLKTAGFQLIGGETGDGSVSLSRLKVDPGRVALVISSGEERLGSFWKAACDSLVHTPADLGSGMLDPSATTAVLLWELHRRRADQDGSGGEERGLG